MLISYNITDILQEVSNPMRFSGEPAPYKTPQDSELKDDFVSPLEAAAKQFNTVSAGGKHNCTNIIF